MAATNSLSPPSPQSSPSTQEQTQADQQQEQRRYRRRLISAASLGGLVLCPLLIALPPRKLDLYTALLVAGTGISANHALREHTGRSITDRVRGAGGQTPTTATTTTTTAAAEVETQARARSNNDNNMAGWKARREAREREALREGGKGYAGLIWDQIWEVWDWGGGERPAGKGGSKRGEGG